MISYRFVPISSQKGVLFFETPGSFLRFLQFLRPKRMDLVLSSPK